MLGKINKTVTCCWRGGSRDSGGGRKGKEMSAGVVSHRRAEDSSQKDVQSNDCIPSSSSSFIPE